MSAESRIAFPAKAELERLIAEAGLKVDQWLGDWHGAPYSDTMPEIIPVGRLAKSQTEFEAMRPLRTTRQAT